MALPKYTEPHYRIWHYIYIFICTCVFFFLIAPLFVIFPLSFNAEEFLSFSEGMKNLDPDAFSLRWYIYHLKENASGSRFFIPSEKLKNSSALNDKGKITNKGAIKKKNTHVQIKIYM